jgi:hypothetical protein
MHRSDDRPERPPRRRSYSYSRLGAMVLNVGKAARILPRPTIVRGG